MNSIRKRGLSALSSLIVLTLILSSFAGMAFAADPTDGGTPAVATSKSISGFDYSGVNAKTFTLGNGSDEPSQNVSITLNQDLVDMPGIVTKLNSLLTGFGITASWASATTFKLTSNVVGKYSLITVSGANAADFFAAAQYRGTATDLESVADTNISLSPLFSESDDSIGQVTGQITLPGSDAVNGTSISWVTANSSVISNTGVVSRQTGNVTVKLTATITKGDAVLSKEFDMTVIGTVPHTGLNDVESVAATKAALTPLYDTDESQGYVKGKITLPVSDPINLTSISWESNDLAIPIVLDAD